MRVLHILASWKWTGPAEPALETAALLAQVPEIELTLAHSMVTKPGNVNHVAREVERLGLAILPGLALPRHFSLRFIFGDVRRLAAHLRKNEYDLIHCHTGVDHLVVGLARLVARSTVPVVRSWYSPDGPTTWREAWLLKSSTAAAIVPGRQARDRVARWGRKRVSTTMLLPPLDLDRFDPARPDMRHVYCCKPEDLVVGVVARMQPHRRWGLLLESFKGALVEQPNLRLLVVGRGPDWDRLVYTPARNLGIGGRLVLAGYRRGEDFAATLRTMDAMAFLQPGSDGTCRALRQALAAGIPAVVAERGLLPELVRQGETGYIVPDDPAALAQALVAFAADREKTRTLGRAAREEAEIRYSPDLYVAKVAAIYSELVGEKPECAG